MNAPQANAMAAIIEPMMTGGSAQWPLYMAGALFAIILWMVKVPPLAFALGTYLPMEINTPITSWWSDCILLYKIVQTIKRWQTFASPKVAQLHLVL